MELHIVTNRKLYTSIKFEDVIRGVIQGGADWIHLRENDLSTKELMELGMLIVNLLRENQSVSKNMDNLQSVSHGFCGTKLSINDRCDVAIALDAHGVQLGVNSLAPEVAKRILPSGVSIGVSTHSLEQAREAEKGGANFIILGHVFETPSKTGLMPLGIEGVRKVIQNIEIPVIVIGGISPESIMELKNSGIHGIAVMSGILSSCSSMVDVRDRVRLYRSVLQCL